MKALIFARGGSKGIRKKNIIELDSKPLIQYTIDASFKALIDSLDYKLYKDKAPASL